MQYENKNSFINQTLKNIWLRSKIVMQYGNADLIFFTFCFTISYIIL
jgi:hypothetical protein